jgi:hypothetical protein
MNISIGLLKEHCKFEDKYDCYVMLGLSRKKDTPEIHNSSEIVFREVLRNEYQLERKLSRLILNCQNYRDDKGETMPFYIYVSCNARNAKNALFDFMGKINIALIEESKGNERSRILKRLDREFISSLSKPASRSKPRYFMFDYDSKEGLGVFLEKLCKLTVIKMVIETRHGYHVKCVPFDPTKLEKEAHWELKTDGYLFLEYINGRD